MELFEKYLTINMIKSAESVPSNLPAETLKRIAANSTNKKIKAMIKALNYDCDDFAIQKVKVGSGVGYQVYGQISSNDHQDPLVSFGRSVLAPNIEAPEIMLELSSLSDKYRWSLADFERVLKRFHEVANGFKAIEKVDWTKLEVFE